MAVSSSVKMLDIVSKLEENDSFELTNTAAADFGEFLQSSVKIII